MGIWSSTGESAHCRHHEGGDGNGSIEGMTGEGLANPCESCGRHSTQPGAPDTVTRIVTYRCPFCAAEWHRPFEDGLYDDDIVRVDLDDGYAYGGVVQIDGDRVLVSVFDPSPRQDWFDLWRIIVY